MQLASSLSKILAHPRFIVCRQLSENDNAEKVFDEKSLRIDKFERELDYAHTKMQDVLEAIMQSKQRMVCRPIFRTMKMFLRMLF